MSKIIGRPLYAPAPAGGATVGSLAVGSSVFTNVNGTKTEFLVVHQGKPSSLYDDSCDGTWLLMKDIYENRQWNSSNVNKYESSTINTYLNNTFLNLFDRNITDAIKQVKIPYRKGGGSGGTDQIGVNGLSCKVFLLSGQEVGVITSYTGPSQEGAKLSYFESGTGSSALNKRIAYLNGSAAEWWLRSPDDSGTNYVWYVDHYGYNDNDLGFAVRSRGVRPAFIIPSETKISKNGLIKP